MASSYYDSAVMVPTVFTDSDIVGDHAICLHQLAFDAIQDAFHYSEGAPLVLQSTLFLEGTDSPGLGTQMVGATRHGLSGGSWARVSPS